MQPLACPELSPTVRPSFQVIGATYQLLLLPVWVARVGDEEAACLALVNGQSGEVAFGPRERCRQEG